MLFKKENKNILLHRVYQKSPIIFFDHNHFLKTQFQKGKNHEINCTYFS